MSRRSNNNQVRGPTSALTSFLREQGITGPAGHPYRRTQQDAQPQQQDPEPSSSRSSMPLNRSDSEDLDDDAIQPATKRHKADDAAPEEDPYTAPSKSQSTAAGGVGSKTACIECQSKVIITKYTPPGPDGVGVICPKCTTALGIDPFKQAQPKPKPKKAPKREKRVAPLVDNSKTLSTLADYSIKVIIDNIDDVENLGEIGGNATNTIAKVLSKNRSLNPKTVQLFLGSHQDSLSLYDCASLDPDCLKSVSTLCQNIKHLKIGFGGQLTTDVVKYWCTRFKNLEHVDIHGAYLVKAEGWIHMLEKLGSNWKTLKISECPHFDERCVKAIGINCHNLHSLSLAQVKANNQCIDHLASLNKLTKFELIEISGEVTSEPIVNLLSHIGPSLDELTLAMNPDLDNEVLTHGVKPHCHNIHRLNLSDCELIDSAGFQSLFNDWNNQGLDYLDLSLNHVLSDQCLETILSHTGSTVERLNINKVKDLSKECLLKIPSSTPKIREIDISWCRQTDDDVIKEFIEKCPDIRKIVCFGCLLVTNNCAQKPGTQIVGCPALTL